MSPRKNRSTLLLSDKYSNSSSVDFSFSVRLGQSRVENGMYPLFEGYRNMTLSYIHEKNV